MRKIDYVVCVVIVVLVIAVVGLARVGWVQYQQEAQINEPLTVTEGNSTTIGDETTYTQVLSPDTSCVVFVQTSNDPVDVCIDWQRGEVCIRPSGGATTCVPLAGR